MTYDRHEPFVPTVENPGPVSFSEDGTYWTIRRDEFYYWADAGMQALVIRHGLAGTELPRRPSTTTGRDPRTPRPRFRSLAVW